MKRPLVFGEVLYDCFPDGREILGGAPFNVAWHLQGLGLNPLLVTGVGRDALGDAILDTMRRWGMDTGAVQRDPQHATGQVRVSLRDGQPSYDIVADQAYDHIGQDLLAGLRPNEFALIYHGSLALRAPTSSDTLDALIASSGLPVFLDLNLRAPWWQRAQLMPLLRRATWVKLNDEELCEVAGLPASRAVHDVDGLVEVAQGLAEECALRWLIVTRGGQGAFVVHPGGVQQGAPIPVDGLVDTVGAGDAFSAVSINGILRGWELEQTLEQALRFAARVCMQRGATSEERTLYAGRASR